MALPQTLPARQPAAGSETSPRLENGDRLTREEFVRRYHGMPGLKKAELIEGVVHMPSPVRTDSHGEPHADLLTLLGLYRLHTRGVRLSDNATVLLDMDNVAQPDIALFVEAARGGRVRVSEDGYVEGAPELIVEIASSSVSYDLYDKLQVYRRCGVQEYLVWRTLDREIDWLRLRSGRYERLEPGEDGMTRSEVFPGLWLDTSALLSGDLARVHAVLAEGLASGEHLGFAERLATSDSE